MKLLKRFIEWWNSFECSTADNSPNSDSIVYKGQKEERQWCPLCGYSGTADNIRCHLLNDHNK